MKRFETKFGSVLSSDQAGNISSEVDTQGGTPTTNSYSYDHANLLTAAGGSNYSYDSSGNRDSAGYTTTLGNEMTSDGTYNYTYDAKGNELTKTDIATGDKWTYGYNNANEMTSAVEETSGSVVEQTLEFKYHIFGNRNEVDVTVGMTTSTTRYAYDMWNPAKAGATGTANSDIWASFTSGGSLTTRQLQGDGVDQHLAYVTSSNAYWYLTDHLNSIRTVINNSGTVQDSVIYDAYGNITYQTPSPATTPLYFYTGREFDVETSLQYNRARYYDATTGRWISQDPMGFDAGDSNLYRYVYNNPTKYTDPSGEIIPVLIGGALAGGAIAGWYLFGDAGGQVNRGADLPPIEQLPPAWVALPSPTYKAIVGISDRRARMTPYDGYTGIIPGNSKVTFTLQGSSGTYPLLEFDGSVAKGTVKIKDGGRTGRGVYVKIAANYEGKANYDEIRIIQLVKWVTFDEKGNPEFAATGAGAKAILGGENDPNANYKGWRVDAQLGSEIRRKTPFYDYVGKSSFLSYSYTPTKATIEDAPFQDVMAGGNKFIDIAIGVKAGPPPTYTYLGNMRWGYKIARDGVVSFIPPTIAQNNAPLSLPPELGPALDRWNQPGGLGQIGNPVVTSGNIIVPQ